MERFIPCQVTDRLDCIDCVFRDRGLKEIEERESFMIRQSGFGFSTKDNNQPTDNMDKSQQIVLNICASVTGKKYTPQQNESLSKRENDRMAIEDFDQFLEIFTLTTLL